MPFLPDDGFLALIESSPPPSFEQRLNALTKAVGPHPLLQELDWDSSSEADAQLSEYEGRPARSNSSRQAEDRKKSAERASNLHGSVDGTLTEGRERQSQRLKDQGTTTTTSTELPLLPAGDGTAAKVGEPSLRSRPAVQEVDVMEVDEPARPPQALPSKPTKPTVSTFSSRRQTRSTRSAATDEVMDVDPSTPHTAAPVSLVKTEPSPSPVKPAPPPSSPIIELSSDDDEDRFDSRLNSGYPRDSKVRAASSAALLAEQKARRSQPGFASSALPSSKTGRGSTITSKGKKPRKSLDDEIVRLQKLSGPKLSDEFKTIADFIAHLEQFEPAVPGKRILEGTRICFVNTDHYRLSASSAILPGNASPLATRNRFDLGLRTWMTVAARNGATLVPPEEFLPPPYDVADSQHFDPVRAEKERWTTHIIPFVPSGGKLQPPSYEQILTCLGPDAGGIRWDELGPFVKVVLFKWVSVSVEAKGRALEFDYEIPGDPRAAERAEREKAIEDPRQAEKRRKVEKEREKRRKTERAEREKEEARRRRPGAKARDESQETDRGDEGSADEEDGRPSGVSPFGPGDWPLGESPPTGYFDQPGSSASYPLSSIPSRTRQAPDPQPSSDPVTDADQTIFRAKQLSVSPTTSPKHSPKSRSKSIVGAEDSQAFSVGDDLRHQFRVIEEMGSRLVDEMLDAEEEADDHVMKEGGDVINWEDEYMILSERPVSDNETEDEREEAEEIRHAGKTKRFNPRARIPRDAKYACDDPSKSSTNGPNEQTARVLGHLADLQEQNSFRQRSYRMAASRLRNFPEVLKHIDQLTQLRGIGQKMAQKILEIQRTGTLRRFSHQTREETAFSLFGNVYGIGKVLCQELYNMGARSIDDLRNDPDKYGLHWDQRIGLEYYDDLLERIPRSEMDELFAIVKAEAYKVDPKIECFCMGSYRRGEPTSGDIDIMVTRPPVHGDASVGFAGKVWRRLEQRNFVSHTLTQPSDWAAEDAVIHGLCKLNIAGAKMRRIDILGVPWDERAAVLIYFYFNRSLRLKARHLGYRLNQRGLYKNVARGKDGLKITEGVKIEGLDTEEKLLAKLKVKWRPPEERKP
ncbi:hypothetical protein JCM11251_004925 [Rhodosporidiobolus azoricus]